MIKVADEIITHGFIKLKLAFMICSPNVTKYKASEARRKLLRMPLACIGVGDQQKGSYCLYLIEKQNSVNYIVFKTLLAKAVTKPGTQTPHLAKEEFKWLLCGIFLNV